MRIHRPVFLWVVIAAIALLVPACGGGGGDSAETEESTAEPSGPSPQEQGQEIADQILATFDEAVAETVRLIGEDPNAGVLVPKVQELLATAEGRMKELNVNFLAIRDLDVAAFGAMNSYIQDQRPQRVHAMDMAFSPFLFDYPGEDPDGAVKELLSGRAFAQLLDVATNI